MFTPHWHPRRGTAGDRLDAAVNWLIVVVIANALSVVLLIVTRIT